MGTTIAELCPSPPSRLPRWAWRALGWLFFAAGVIGVVLPGLPTTGPMIMALGCFAKADPKLHRWLLNHRIFGPPLRHWQTHRTMPLKAKLLAISMMLSSFGYVALFTELSFPLVALIGGLILVGVVVVLRVPTAR